MISDRKKSILIVDDSREDCALLGHIVAELGFESRAAHDGQEALALLGEEEPLAIICDIHMPVMDGMRFLLMLRVYDPQRILPVIIVSADSQEGTRLSAMRLGANAWLDKPIIKSAVQDVLRSVLPGGSC